MGATGTGIWDFDEVGGKAGHSPQQRAFGGNDPHIVTTDGLHECWGIDQAWVIGHTDEWSRYWDACCPNGLGSTSYAGDEVCTCCCDADRGGTFVCLDEGLCQPICGPPCHSTHQCAPERTVCRTKSHHDVVEVIACQRGAVCWHGVPILLYATSFYQG